MILKEHVEVTAEKLDPEDKEYLKTFQELNKLLYDNFSNKDTRISSLADYKQFKRDLKRFSNYPFAQLVFNKVNQLDDEVKDIFKSRRQSRKSTANYSEYRQHILSLIQQGELDKAHRLSKELIQDIKSLETGKKDPGKVVSSKENPYRIENPLIFQSTNFLRQYEKEDMQRLINKDIDKYQYSYLPLPRTKLDDFQYMIYFIQELEDQPQQKELSAKEFQRYLDFRLDSPEWDELKDKIQTYLQSNKKDLIPEIVEGINKFSILRKANERRKKEIDTVYRGLPLAEEPSVRDMIKHDKEQDYVATTLSYRPALNFAAQVGHIQSLRNARTEEGVVLTYSVNRDAIAFDTSIFGGIFGENEVVIDPNQAEVEDYEVVDFDEYRGEE